MLDTQKTIDAHFGGPKRLWERLQAEFGASAPPLNTVQKWRQRGSIPSEWLTALLVLRERDAGKPVSVKPLLTAKGRQEWPRHTSKTKPAATGKQPGIFD